MYGIYRTVISFLIKELLSEDNTFWSFISNKLFAVVIMTEVLIVFLVIDIEGNNNLFMLVGSDGFSCFANQIRF